MVLRYDGTTGAFINAFVPPGSGGLAGGTFLTFGQGPSPDLFVSSAHTDSVLRYNGTTGQFISSFVAPNSGGLHIPEDLVFGSDHNLYVSSFGTNSILKYDGTNGAFIGAFVASSSGGLVGPHGLTFGPDGNLYVTYNAATEPPANPFPGGVKRYDGRSGAFIDDLIGPVTSLAAGGPVRAKAGIFGPDTNFYVSSSDTSEIFRVSAIPEPSTSLLMITGIAGMYLFLKRRTRAGCGHPSSLSRWC